MKWLIFTTHKRDWLNWGMINNHGSKLCHIAKYDSDRAMTEEIKFDAQIQSNVNGLTSGIVMNILVL